VQTDTRTPAAIRSGATRPRNLRRTLSAAVISKLLRASTPLQIRQFYPLRSTMSRRRAALALARLRIYAPPPIDNAPGRVSHAP
jgi:hypothetical protein